MLRDRVRRAVRRRRTSVAVVVAVGPRQLRFLDECLGSLGRQHRPPAEVLVCPWGGAALPPEVDGARVLAGTAVANTARNLGASASTADAVVFLDATETLVPDGLARLVGELGRDRAVVAGAGPHLAERLWRRSAALTFPPEHGRLPQASLARRPDLELGVRVSSGNERVWGTPFGFVPSTAAEVDQLAALVADGIPAAALAEVAPAFLDDLEHAQGDAADRLAEALRALPPDTLDQVPVETRLRLWLLAHGHREAMSRFTVDRWFDQGQFPTRVEEGVVHAVLPVPGVAVPDEVLVVEPTLRVSLQRFVRDGNLLRATVYIVVPEVDYATHEPVLGATWVHVPSGARIDAVIGQRRHVAATRFGARFHQNHDAGVLDVTLDADELEVSGDWRLVVDVDVAGLRLTGPVSHREERGSAGMLEGTPSARLDPTDGLVVTQGQRTDLPRPDQTAPAVDTVELHDAIVLHGTAPVPFALQMRWGDRTVEAEVTFDGGTFTATVPLVWDPWSLGGRALPSGTWHFTWATSGDALRELPVPATLAGATPLERTLARHRVVLRRGLRGQLLAQLSAPLRDDELGPWGQQLLRTAYATTTAPVDPELALFSAYAGTAATDSPRAIFEELRRRRPALRCLWVVADHSVAPPEGAQPVLLRSREWYDALARAALVVSNVEMDRFFTTRPGQRLVQTFHGYPSKAMGLGLWRAKNFSPLRQQRQLAETAGNWSVALTPAPEMDRHYREQYLFEGPYLNRGYPRDDALVGPDAGALRGAARARLGLSEDDVAVLYAPTWRDDVATNYRAAPLVPHLDVERLASNLGERYVVLLRGHRFHQAPGSAARVLDTTGYPEINDLVLAADVAVLDYSSLRFDFALTGRPMVFLVPDLEAYAGDNRGFLFPFTDSTPGPLVASTDAVVALLRDVPALGHAWADRVAEFNRTFNANHDGAAAVRVVDSLLDD